MKFNFKKMSAVLGSVLMAGATLGFAAAANYPAPFVTNGVGNVAIVYGTGAGVSALDQVQAANIQNSLGASVTGGTVNVSGEVVPLDRGSSSRLWLNTSLTTAQSIYTKTDLPTVLADSTFSGDVSATVTQQITFIAGTNAGGSNSGKVMFGKEPTSSVDPRVGVSLGTDASQPLYNATVNFNNAVNFTSTNSQGQTLNLFGKDYVVSSDTSTTNGLVLFQSAQTVTLTQGGTSTGADTATVSINGASHTVQLLNAGTTSATVSVDGTSQSVNVGSSRTINGVSIAVTSVQSSTAGGNTATVLVGANKLTFKNGQQVTQGDSNTVILGTTAYIGGSVTALTSLTVAVYAQDSTHDFIASGDAFKDPVFGSFAVSNSGLNSPVDSTSRDTIKVGTSGSTTLTLSMKDKNGNSATFDWATNSSSSNTLLTSTGYHIYPYEMANLSLNDYTFTGTGSSNQNVGHLLQLQVVYNDSSTSTNDYVQFYDPISGTTLKTGTPTAEGSAPLTIDGRQYTVAYNSAAGSSASAWAQIKFPTTDSGTSDVVLFPTILANGGESVEIYAPQNLSMAAFNGTAGNNVGNYKLSNGNGYTSAAIAYVGAGYGTENWTVGGNTIITGNGTITRTAQNVTVGQMTYTFTGDIANRTVVKAWVPGKGLVSEPAVVVFEGKDQNNVYNAVVLDSKTAPAGTSTDGVGINGVYFTSSTNYGVSSALNRYSNTNIADYMDSYGTFATKDSTTSAQPTASLTYPAQQAYEQLYIGETSASVSSGNALGDVLVKDSEVASVASKNLVIVGGSCINSAAATALGVASHTCGDAFTAATGVGAGQFLIKGVQDAFSTGKLALVVAGYDQPDTVNAATYLTKKTVDTSKTYIGTSSTEATLQVA